MAMLIRIDPPVSFPLPFPMHHYAIRSSSLISQLVASRRFASRGDHFHIHPNSFPPLQQSEGQVVTSRVLCRPCRLPNDRDAPRPPSDVAGPPVPRWSFGPPPPLSPRRSNSNMLDLHTEALAIVYPVPISSPPCTCGGTSRSIFFC